MKTFGDLKTQLEKEMDTEEEDFIQTEEVQNYFNSAVTLCESEIIKLGLREQYLLKEHYIDAVAGTSDYDLPADIVANKVRKVVYRNEATIFTVPPLRGEAGPETEDLARINPASENYEFEIIKVGENNVFRITPRASLSVTSAFRMLYFAKLNRFDDDATNCDVPDICYEYILSYVRYRIYMKERHSNTQAERQDMLALLILMRETLQNQVADPDMDLLDMDLTHYEEYN